MAYKICNQFCIAWLRSTQEVGAYIMHRKARLKRIYTLSKNDTALACYNFDEHRTILIILAEMLLRN